MKYALFLTLIGIVLLVQCSDYNCPEINLKEGDKVKYLNYSEGVIKSIRCDRNGWNIVIVSKEFNYSRTLNDEEIKDIEKVD